MKYTAPIAVTQQQLLQIEAIAYAVEHTQSSVATAIYDFILPTTATPVFTPPSGIYASAQLVTFSDATPGAAIYVGTNALAEPPLGEYTQPILVSASHTTFQAVAQAPGYYLSGAIGAAYAIIGSPAAFAALASGVNGNQATLNAFVDTLGLPGFYFFRYGTSQTSLNSETSSTALTVPATPVHAAAQLTGLPSGVTYYYQVVVTTKGGTTEGAVLAFTTEH